MANGATTRQAPDVLSPVRQIQAYELVVEQMRRAITSGQMMPGEKFPTERDLAEMLDVSRATLRRAIDVLEAEGLLTVRRGRAGGFIVRDRLNWDAAIKGESDLKVLRKEVERVFDARVVLEGGAAALASEQKTTSSLRSLKSLLRKLDVAVERAVREVEAGVDDDAIHQPYLHLDAEFHQAIVRIVDNPFLERAVAEARASMWAPVGALFRRVINPEWNDDHHQIYDAIANGEAELARQLMTDHINYTRAWLLALVH